MILLSIIYFFSKLSFYTRIRGVGLEWFKSFLSNRSQTPESVSSPILHGVPQASFLGLLLFLVYVNDLQVAIPYSLTMLLNQSEILKSLSRITNINFKYLNNWLNANMISLNCKKKSDLLLFYPSLNPSTHEFKVKINGRRLNSSDSVICLGIIFDSSFNWGSHKSLVCKRLPRANVIKQASTLCVSGYFTFTILLSLSFAS